MFKRYIFALLFSLLAATGVHAQNASPWPDVITSGTPYDFGNGPLKLRVILGTAYVFSSQGTGVGSTSGSSTALTLTTTPTTPPIVGSIISGNGIAENTTVTAYDGTTGITLSAPMSVTAGTALSWGAACPNVTPAHYIQASAGTDYYQLFTTARICGVSPGGPSQFALTIPFGIGGGGDGGNGITSLTGDVTAIGPGAAIATLATVLGTPGTFGSASQIPSFTVNAKGLITSVSNNSIQAPAGSLTGTTLASGVVNSSLTSVGTLTGGATGAGFTVNLGSSTIAGTLPASAFPALSGDVTTSSGSTVTSIGSNKVTNSQLAQAPAATLKGNATGSTANVTDISIQSLTNLASPSPTLDFMPIYDHLTGTLKNVTPSSLNQNGSVNPKQFGAKGDLTQFTDGTITAGTAAFSSSSATFVSTDCTGGAGCTGTVNKKIRVQATAPATISNGSPAIVTWANHGLSAGTRVVFSTSGTLPSPLSTLTVYYVISTGLSANTFEISNTSGGPAIATVSAGSGSHTAAASVILDTSIIAFTDIHHVTLSNNAAGSYSGAYFAYGTDDTTAIQAAINAAQGVVPTGSLYLPGSYITTSTLNTMAGLTIYGDGVWWNLFTIAANIAYVSGSYIQPPVGTNAVSINSVAGVTFRNFGVVYPTFSNTNVVAVTVQSPTQLNTSSVWRDFTVINSDVPFSVQQAALWTMDNVKLVNWTTAIVAQENVLGGDPGDNIITNSYMASLPNYSNFAGGLACVTWTSGGALHFKHNNCLNAAVGVQALMLPGIITGQMEVTGNTFDNGPSTFGAMGGIVGLQFSRQGTTGGFGRLIFSDNILNGAFKALSIPFDANGLAISDVLATNNTVLGESTGSPIFFDIHSTSNILISNNVMNSSVPTTVGYNIGSDVSVGTIGQDTRIGSFSVDSISTTSVNFPLRNHVITQSNASPTGSCTGGTGAIGNNSTDTAGILTSGAGATACSIIFARAYASAPFCTLTGNVSSAVPAWTVSASAITLSVASASTVYTYHCIGQGGG